MELDVTSSESARFRVRVADPIDTGILTTDADTPLRAVPRLMSNQRVHAVLSEPNYAERPDRFVTTRFIATAAAEDSDPTAGKVTGEDVLMVSSARPPGAAAIRLLKHGASHAVVSDPETAYPVGILSTLAAACAG